MAIYLSIAQFVTIQDFSTGGVVDFLGDTEIKGSTNSWLRTSVTDLSVDENGNFVILGVLEDFIDKTTINPNAMISAAPQIMAAKFWAIWPDEDAKTAYFVEVGYEPDNNTYHPTHGDSSSPYWMWCNINKPYSKIATTP